MSEHILIFHFSSQNNGFTKQRIFDEKKKKNTALEQFRCLIDLTFTFYVTISRGGSPTIPLSRWPLCKGDGLQMSSKPLFADEKIKRLMKP